MSDYRNSPYYWAWWSALLIGPAVITGDWFFALMFGLAYYCFWDTLRPRLRAK